MPPGSIASNFFRKANPMYRWCGSAVKDSEFRFVMPVLPHYVVGSLRGKKHSTNRRLSLSCLRAALSCFLVLWLSAPWASLQIVAWTTMLGNNLESHSFGEAVTQTFDGQHPCCLCKMIAAGKNSEKNNTVLPQTQKLEYTTAAEKIALIAPLPASALSIAHISARSFSSKPLLPPPRGCFV
jgi:hypothetical protein